MQTDRTELETWIRANLSLVESTSADLIYERMESQSGRCLPVLYEPIDHTKRSHWHDEALIGAFAYAMGDARVILDVGPGDGWPSLRLAPRFDKIVGIDPSPRRVSVQKENAERLGITGADFLQMDVLSMDFADESFDGVTAASAIEQTGDPARALEEVFRVLRPGGALAMIFEDYDACLAADGEEEKLRAELSGEEPAIFYEVRSASPPRETWYALSLNPKLLAEDRKVRKAAERACARDLSANATRAVAALTPAIAGAKFFELSHLTSTAIDRMLEEVGFEAVRHTDHRVPELLSFFDEASAAGRLETWGPAFEVVAEEFGISAIDSATEGPGDFVIARKPGGRSPSGNAQNR